MSYFVVEVISIFAYAQWYGPSSLRLCDQFLLKLRKLALSWFHIWNHVIENWLIVSHFPFHFVLEFWTLFVLFYLVCTCSLSQLTAHNWKSTFISGHTNLSTIFFWKHFSHQPPMLALVNLLIPMICEVCIPEFNFLISSAGLSSPCDLQRRATPCVPFILIDVSLGTDIFIPVCSGKLFSLARANKI